MFRRIGDAGNAAEIEAEFESDGLELSLELEDRGRGGLGSIISERRKTQVSKDARPGAPGLGLRAGEHGS